MADITLAGQVEYRDPTHISDTWNVDIDDIPTAVNQNASQIRTKMYGVDVRESLARWVELTGYMLSTNRAEFATFKNLVNSMLETFDGRIEYVEGGFQDFEIIWNQFQQNIAESSDNSAESAALAQIITANTTAIEGHSFNTLTDMVSFMYQLIAANVAAGYDIPITYTGSAQPTVAVTSWTNGITSESIFDENDLPLQSSAIETVTSKVVYGSLNADGTRNLTVTLPLNYKSSDANDGILQLLGTHHWRIINYADNAGTRTIDIIFN
ncbi:hypothetical protein EQG49_11240 [Periweissella cryptocerci]|uniref:Baseplate upper protein immunoglobulin like domain-containing protein n=1 Tax=Periweissella cryptocerci TaxID=2506420 RepID=A0A4P6YW19_9LACO|nr:hypothetical protein [Periweissella cryptocerci]QBO36981.1 hypothetical protein EQG49_11240 [Periweissella cryptocerci]